MTNTVATHSMSPDVGEAGSVTNKIRTNWIVPGVALLLIVTLLWLPFGFQMTGLVEEWGVVYFLQQQPLFYLTEYTPLASHRIRPLEVLPHTLAYMLTPDSFVGFNILHWLFFVGKGIFAFALLRQLSFHPALAFFTAVLFLIYPADTGLFTFRAIHIHCAIFLLLLALYLLTVYWQHPRWYTLLGMWAALASTLLMYEISYLIIAATPLMLLYLAGKVSRRLIWVTCLWYIVPAIVALQTIIILKQPSEIYQTEVITKLPSTIGGVVFPLLNAYSRSFVGGWQDALQSFDTTYLLVAAAIAIVTLAASLWLFRQAQPASLPLRQEVRRYALLFVIGLAIIPLGYALYLLSPAHTLQIMRTYLIPSLGASVCIACVGWLVLRPVRYRVILFSALMTIFVGIASVSALGNHAYYYALSLREQRLLGQLVSQAPGLSDGDTVVVIDKFGYFSDDYNFGKGADLGYAVNYLYSTTGIKLQVCHPFGILTSLGQQCEFQAQGISVVTQYETPPIEQTYPYDETVLFELTPTFNLVLLTPASTAELVALGLQLPTYTVADAIRDAPLPRRVTTLFSCWPIETCTTSITYAVQRAAHIDFGMPINGIGWRDAEVNNLLKANFRWSVSPRSQLYTRLEAGHAYRIRVRIVSAINPDVLESLKLHVNDHPIALLPVDDGSALRVFEGQIPSAVIAIDEALTTMTFTSDLAVVRGTTIALGLAFSEIIIEATN